MLKSDKIYIAGHRGLVGSAIVRLLKDQEYNNIIYASHEELDLRNQNATFEFFEKNKPDYVFLAAAKVGGIYANNTYPAEFIYDNLQIECNIIHAAYEYKVKKLLLLGSTCFTPNSIIKTEKSYKFIQDIKIGDKVLTDKNRYMPIIKTHKREINEDILRINFWGWNRIECTKEHRIYTVNSGFKKAEELISKDILIIPIDTKKLYPTKINIFVNKELEKKYDSFLKYKSLTPKDNLNEFCRNNELNRNIINAWKRGAIPYGFKIKNKEFNLEKELGFLSGFFVADGYISGNNIGKRGSKYLIGFSKSIEILNIIKGYMANITNDTLHIINKKTCDTLTISNQILFDYFKQFYKGYEKGKVKGTYPKIIPDFIKYNKSDKVIKAFIHGYWIGDGHFSSRKNRTNEYLAATASTSKDLIYNLQMLLARLKILSSVYIKKLPPKKIFEGRIINQKTQYHLRITGKWAEIFGKKILGKDLKKKGKIKDTYIEFKDNYIYMGIRSISNIQYKGFVHDLSVDEDHTYTCNGFIVHNCIYPKYAPQPMKEEHLMTGALEPTNAPYGLAKIAGIMMCESYNRQYNTNFISCMPTNLFGIGDNYHPENSHVLPALIQRIHEAKIVKSDKVVIWGTGNPLREFLYVDDLADACIFLMQKYKGNETINIGSGTEVKIYDLAVIIKEVLEYKGEITTDPSKPDGTPRKFIDSSKIYNLGWKPKVNIREGIRRAYNDFLKRFGGEKWIK